MSKREFAIFMEELKAFDKRFIGFFSVEWSNADIPTLYNIQVNISYEVPDKKEDDL